MNWFEVIKENRLRSQNITHTKVNEDPDVEDDRCKKRLKEILTRFRNAVTYPHKRARADDGGFLSFQNSTPTQELVVTMDIRINGQPDISGSFLDEPDALPSEEDCCFILEELAKLGKVEMGHTNDGYTMTFHESSGKRLPTSGRVYASSMAFYSDKNDHEVLLEDLDDEDGGEIESVTPKKVARKVNVSKFFKFNHLIEGEYLFDNPFPETEKIIDCEISVLQLVDLDYSGAELHILRNKWFLFPLKQVGEIMAKVEAKFSELIR